MDDDHLKTRKRKSRAERRRSMNVIARSEEVAVDGLDDVMTGLGVEKNSLRILAHGHRGIVYVGRCKEKTIAIKLTGLARTEATWLSRVNDLGLGPRLLYSGESSFAMEFVSGLTISDALRQDGDRLSAIVASLLDQCWRLDQAGINKSEMGRLHKHVVVSHDIQKLTMLDFERCSYSSRPQNVTQLCQYLSSNWVAGRLAAGGIHVDVSRVRERASEYKKDPRRTNFRLLTLALGLSAKNEVVA